MFSKNILQQYCQQKKLGSPPYLPEYKVAQRGPAHHREFNATVIVGEQQFQTEQWYNKKKTAEIEAAALALEKLGITSNSINKNYELATDKVNKFFNEFKVLLKDLKLDKQADTLPLLKQKQLLQNLTFAFLHATVAGHLQCKLLIKDKLGLIDSIEVVDYNGLECMGDAVLQCLVTKHLFIELKIQQESQITKTRATLVNQQKLNQVMVASGLNKYIMYIGNVELSETSIPGDVLEALIGAIYLVFGEKETERVVREILKLY